MSMTGRSTAISSGCARSCGAVDDDFDDIETLYGLGYRLREQ